MAGALSQFSKGVREVSPEAARSMLKECGYFQANTGCSSSATRVPRPANTSRNW